VKLPEWEMSRSAANFLGSFIQERIRRAVYSRWKRSVDGGPIPPFYLYVDEFQAFATTRFEEMVAEARKFGLCLTLSHQNIRQLEQFSRHTGGASASLLEAVFGNVSTMVYMGGSSRDEEIISAELAIPRGQLSSVERFGAVARILFENESVTCTLQFPLATAVSGLPRSGDAVRNQMINNGHWVKREDLRRRLESRFDRIAELIDRGWWNAGVERSSGGEPADGSNGRTSPIKRGGEQSRDEEEDEEEEDEDNAEEREEEEQNKDEDEVEAKSAQDLQEERNPPNLNISWPWPERADVKRISYSLCDGRLNIIVTPGPSGLRFLKSWVRFTRGLSYQGLAIPPYESGTRKRASDTLPIIVSIPYIEGSIEKVSYTIERGMINIIYRFTEAADVLRRKDVSFSRMHDPCSTNTGGKTTDPLQERHV
jgi:hypothetical protein